MILVVLLLTGAVLLTLTAYTQLLTNEPAGVALLALAAVLTQPAAGAAGGDVRLAGGAVVLRRCQATATMTIDLFGNAQHQAVSEVFPVIDSQVM
jgi:hypothetical protein